MFGDGTFVAAYLDQVIILLHQISHRKIVAARTLNFLELIDNSWSHSGPHDKSNNKPFHVGHFLNNRLLLFNKWFENVLLSIVK